MRYVLKRQFARGTDSAFAEFTDIHDAEFFIEKRIESDRAQNVKVTYRIYEFNEVIKEFDPNKQNTAQYQQGSQSKDQQGSQGKSSTANFRPTPFNTTPRPPGSPPNWLKDDEDEKKK